jgi:hypothetical protein
MKGRSLSVALGVKAGEPTQAVVLVAFHSEDGALLAVTDRTFYPYHARQEGKRRLEAPVS